MSVHAISKETPYIVVFNLEEQYSVWPAAKQIPLGWSPAGKRGPKSECLAYIREVWTDLRPASLRRQMENAGHFIDTSAKQSHSLAKCA